MQLIDQTNVDSQSSYHKIELNQFSINIYQNKPNRIMLLFKSDDSAIKVIKSTPQPCRRHQEKQIVFVCLTCAETTPLLCSECIFNHKQHTWVPFNKYRDDEALPILKQDMSPRGKEIVKILQEIHDLLGKFQQKVSRRVQAIEQKLKIDLEILKEIFPLEGGYKLKGTVLDHKAMSQIITIIDAQKNFYEAKRLFKVFDEIFKTSEMNINENFDKLEDTLNDQHWEKFRKRDLEFLENSYVSAFKKPTNKRDFYFSTLERSKCVAVQQERSIAALKIQSPPYAGILADKFFNTDNDFVAFQIVNIPATLKFFKNTTIYLGASVYEQAQKCSYHGLFKPSQGGYMISSSGKSFHSKYPEFHEKNINFSFGVDDIISILVDYEKRSILFQKQTGFLFTRFEMPLGLDQKFMTKLRPSVCFDGELGAQVQIFSREEFEYVMKSRKNKKKAPK